jgi:hypothetical protein
MTSYQNEFGTYFVAAEGPSCLDDQVHISAGNGKPWKIVKFGVHISSDSRTGKFLVRWRGYETFTGNLGQGVSAFSDEFFDAGFYIERNQFPPTPPGQSTFMITGDLTQNPIFVVPNQTCYLASQFREPHPLGQPVHVPVDSRNVPLGERRQPLVRRPELQRGEGRVHVVPERSSGPARRRVALADGYAALDAV